MLATVAALLVSAAPQGLTIALDVMTLEDAPPEAAERVASAVRDELTRQGYAVVKPGKAQARATVTASVKKASELYIVRLVLARAGTEPEVLDEEKLSVANAQLSQATVEATKLLATELRLAFGVRAKIKF